MPYQVTVQTGSVEGLGMFRSKPNEFELVTLSNTLHTAMQYCYRRMKEVLL